MDDQTANNSLWITDALKMFICGCFAMIGGIVREIKSDKEMTWVRFLAGAFVGVFAGIVVFCLMRHYGSDDWITAAFTALAGYMGTPALDFVSRLVKAALTR